MVIGRSQLIGYSPKFNDLVVSLKYFDKGCIWILSTTH